MSVVDGGILGIKEFLGLPEFRPPMDFDDGRVIQKTSPKLRHTLIQQELFLKLDEHTRAAKSGKPYVELRCQLNKISVVFDVCFILQDRRLRVEADENADVKVAPDIAVEILSPGQTVSELKRKPQASIRQGVRLGWLISPRKQQFLILRKGRRPEILNPGALLTGG